MPGTRIGDYAVTRKKRARPFRLMTNPVNNGDSSKGNSLSIENITSRGVYPGCYTLIGVEI